MVKANKRRHSLKLFKVERPTLVHPPQGGGNKDQVPAAYILLGGRILETGKYYINPAGSFLEHRQDLIPRDFFVHADGLCRLSSSNIAARIRLARNSWKLLTGTQSSGS